MAVGSGGLRNATGRPLSVPSPIPEGSVRNFLHDHVDPGVFDPDAVRILIAAFDSAWQSIKTSEANLSNEQIELMRATLAKYIIEQARHGELDQGCLRDGALVHLAQSNLRYRRPLGSNSKSDQEPVTVRTPSRLCQSRL